MEKNKRAAVFKYAVIAGLYLLLGWAVGAMLAIQAADPLAGDFGKHLSAARCPTGDEYSLLTILYQLMDRVWQGNGLIILFLVFIVLAGIALCAALFMLHSPIKDPLAATVLAIACYCADPLFIPALNPYRVLGVQAGGVWHNPTLLGIKTMLIALVLVYLAICKQMKHKMPVKLLVLFSVLLMIGTWIKPNLASSLEPALAFFILFDLCRQKGKGFWRLTALAATVVPSLVVVVSQMLSTFTGAPAGEESGIAFMIGGGIFTWTKHPICAILQTLAFPLAVLIFSIPNVFTERKYGFAWAIAGFAYLQYLFFVETGARAGDGNFSWGVQMIGVYLFAASVIRLVEAWPSLWKKPVGKVWLIVCTVLFGMQTVSGLHYIILFLQNRSYFM